MRAMRANPGGSPRTWLAMQRAVARKRRVINRTNAPAKPRKPKFKKAQFVRAMRGTCGIYTLIAENLRCNPHTVRNLLNRPDWEDVRAEWASERAMLVDKAYGTVDYALSQRVDIGTAANTAKWVLQHLERERFGEGARTVVVEGGKNPIRTENKNVNVNANIDVSELGLPVEARRAILMALDARDRERENAALAAEQARVLPCPTPTP